jgi:hypothetical protein
MAAGAASGGVWWPGVAAIAVAGATASLRGQPGSC